MPYSKGDMYYNDYRWTAQADHDNPKVIGGIDHDELDRTQGYEMLYFINSLAKTWSWTNVPISSYQHLERIIRTEVPSNIQTHTGIKNWIAAKYKEI